MKKIIIISLFSLMSMVSLAQKAEVFSTSAGAIKGYDPVAYFTEGKPVKGNSDITFLWNGATWHFSNQANLNSFKASPEKYAPQFGGYCAYGVADNHKAPVDPLAWTIVEGKLYLNYNADVKVLWNNNEKVFIEKANSLWPAIKDNE